MFTKRLISLLAVFLGMAFSFGAYAQNVTVTGTVSDNVGPVGMVVVYVPGSSENTMTDLDGKYEISVPSNATLEFSCMGYVTVQIPVDGRDVIDVMLETDNVLEESVVLGYGATTKKKDLSASVGVIDNVEELAARPVSSAQAMLQGQVAGVSISADGGAPTSTPNVVIRGQGSRNGDSVLWVVDGIPGAPFSMNDVESIVVLKDAASAAIYGAQSGAGGVILVTTKKGGEKGISVDYDGVYGIRQATNLIKPLNAQQQIDVRAAAHAADGLTLADGWNTTLNPWIAETRTDWMDEIFRTAFYQRHSVALNYNTDKLKSRLSVSYDDNDGVLLGAWNRQLKVRYVGEYNINKWIKITEDMNWGNNNSRGVDTSGRTSGAVLSAVWMPSSAEAYKADGSFGGTFTEDPEYVAKYGQHAGIFGDVISPLRTLLGSQDINESNDFWSTTGVEIHDIVKGLKFNSRYTFNRYQSFYKGFNPRRLEIGKPADSNSLNYNTTKNYNWKTENTLTYDRTFGDHTVGGLVATTASHYHSRYFSVSGGNFADESPNLQYLGFAQDPISASDSYGGDDNNVAVVARAAYSYDDRYFVTASWRRDYASRLPQGAKYGDFPAATAAWKISNEPFFPKSPALSQLKIRASWGRIGNLGSVGMNYAAATLSSRNFGNELPGYGAEGPEYGKTGWYNNLSINNRLTWETSQQLDLGVDLDMFNDRLNIAVDYYDKLTYNLIQEQSMGWTGSIGLSPMLVNQGKIRNRGVEASIGWSDQIGEFSYYVNANYAFNKNTVEDIGIKDPEGNPGLWTNDPGEFGNLRDYYQTCEGGEVRSFYLIECAGIFQSIEEIYAHQKDGKLIQPNAQPGDLKFVDYNDNGTIDNGDKQYWGNWMPHSNYALSAGFNWKGLSASLMLQGVAGAKAFYPGKLYLVNEAGVGFNRSSEILNAWTPENTDTNIPRLTTQDTNANFNTTSTWYLEDASYLRIKNVTVGYDFTNLLRKAGHFNERNSRLSVYFSGENLFTFTKYSGMDPEVSGFDACKFPVSRVLSLGVKLTY